MPADVALAESINELRRALRSGVLTTSDGVPLPDHPSLWAPFLILGDGGYTYS